MSDNTSRIPTSSDIAALLRESEALQARTDYMLNSALAHLGRALADVKTARSIIRDLITECELNWRYARVSSQQLLLEKAKAFILEE